MPATLPKRSNGLAGFAPVLVANVIPLVGVVEFGWDPATLVAIYGIEMLASILLAGAKAPFARRRPPADRDGVLSVSNAELTHKRGRVEPVAWLPPIYPRNLPFAAAVIGGVAWFAVLFGVVLAEVFDVADALASPAVAAGAVSLFVGQLVETRRGYFRDRRYEEVSPYAVIETPARQAFFLAFVLFATPVIDDAAGGSGATVLGVVVLVKLLVEWSAFRATHGDGGGRFTGWLSGPDEATGPPDPVDVPAREPSARVPTDRSAVLVTAVLRTLSRTAPKYVGWFVGVWLVSVAVVAGSDASRLTILGSAGVVCGLYAALLLAKVGEFYLRYGRLEYRRYGDRLVAHDTWLDEPQWSASVGALRDVGVVTDRLPDRVFGTRTFEVTTGWGDDETGRCVGPVAEPDALVEAFELPVRTTRFRPLDRRVAAASAAVAGGIAVAVVALAVGPWASLPSLLYAAFLLPLAAIASRALWKRAYPESD